MSDKSKGKRVTIDLSPAAVGEVDRLREVTGLTTADLFRNGFSLLRIYVDAKEHGQSLAIVEGERLDEIATRIEMPIVVSRKKQAHDKQGAANE